jgi:hypothetical protein
MYIIKPNEPEGWLKAFEVFFAGRKVAHFRFKDDAEYWIKEQFA